MKQSRLFLTTLRANPEDAEMPSHQLLLRAGVARPLTGGVYSLLPLGLRVLHRIEGIVRREMDAAGGQEVLLPSLQPEELWVQSGRREALAPQLFRSTDRHGHSFVLGPGYEEVITSLIRDEVQSYRQLPLLLYQVQPKFRNEFRPHAGLLFSREYRIKDAYSFDLDAEGLDHSYRAMYEAYSRIFTRLGVDFRAVEAPRGEVDIEGLSHEFMMLSNRGEDTIVECSQCGYALHFDRPAANHGAARDFEEVAAAELPPESTAVTDTRIVKEGDLCPRCQALLRVSRAIEVGRILKLGTRYSQVLDSGLVDENGEQHPILMGSYELGTTRILQAIVEQCHDESGIIWPLAVAPYQVHVLPVSMRDEEQVRVAQVLYQRFQAAAVEVLYDDRDERVGVKLRDSDLLGIPVRLTVGSRVREGEVEIRLRWNGEAETLPIESAFQGVLNLVK